MPHSHKKNKKKVYVTQNKEEEKIKDAPYKMHL